MRQPQRSTCNPSGLGMVHQRQATSSSETCNRWFREKHDRFSATPNLSNCTLSSISLCGETAQVSKRIRSIKARRQKENPSPPLEDTYMTSAKYLDSLDSLPPCRHLVLIHTLSFFYKRQSGLVTSCVSKKSLNLISFVS